MRYKPAFDILYDKLSLCFGITSGKEEVVKACVQQVVDEVVEQRDQGNDAILVAIVDGLKKNSHIQWRNRAVEFVRDDILGAYANYAKLKEVMFDGNNSEEEREGLWEKDANLSGKPSRELSALMGNQNGWQKKLFGDDYIEYGLVSGGSAFYDLKNDTLGISCTNFTAFDSWMELAEDTYQIKSVTPDENRPILYFDDSDRIEFFDMLAGTEELDPATLEEFNEYIKIMKGPERGGSSTGRAT